MGVMWMMLRNVEVVVLALALVWGFALRRHQQMTRSLWAAVVLASVAVVAVMVLYPLYW